AEDPDVALLVVLRAVTGEVVLRTEPAPVGLLVALRVTPDPAEHRRPRFGEDQIADLLRLVGRLALVIEDLGADPGDGPLRGPRLQLTEARQGTDHDGAGLGLPPGVDDRRRAGTDVLLVPQPRLGVDGLADRSEQPDRGEVELGRDRLAPLHEG